MTADRKQRRAQAQAGGKTTPGDRLTEARILIQHGEADAAEVLLDGAIREEPSNVAALRLSGMLAMRRQQAALAVDRFAAARALEPEAAAHANNLGLALRASGRTAEAIASFEAAIALAPGHARAHKNLGLALLSGGRAAEGEAALRKALELDPAYASAACQLAQVLRRELRHDEAVTVLRAAAGAATGANEVLAELGLTFDLQRRLMAAERVWRQLIEREPANPSWPHRLAHALAGQGRMAEAAASFEHCLALDPDAPDVLSGLAELRKQQNRLDEAEALLRRAERLVPEVAAVGSNLLVVLHYGTEDGAALLAAHRDWARRHTEKLPALPQRAVLDHGGSRLRVGYVSPDFRRHSAAFFAEPLLEAHDRSAIEIHCYADVTREDAYTARIRGLADRWTNCVAIDDATLAQTIAWDGIDILVDLCGHFGGNRLGAFARRPAPVQVTWMGYPGTTGLRQIGWRVSDAIADPEGAADGHHSERLMRLGDGFLCYRPDDDAPGVAPLPRLRAGHVTFGSFNNLAKVTAQVIACWSRLLAEVPGAVLLLKDRGFNDEEVRRDHLERFARHGIGEERLSLHGRIEDSQGHLGLYGAVDIALDPFPYNGTTTTCEALWMGVPVVSLRGDRHASRVGASLLARIGLEELVAGDEAAYRAIAAALATDRARLVHLRRTMRERLRSSPLLDKAGFARRMEAAYREMAAAAPA